MQRNLIALLAGVALCSSARGEAPEPNNVGPPATRAPDFNDGYSDGCAHATFGNTKNEARHKSNVSYRTGWNTGFYNSQTHSQMQNAGKPSDHLFGLY